MKTYAFKSTIENNKIQIPETFFADMQHMNGKEVRVILLAEDSSEFNEEAFKEFTKYFFHKYSNNIETIKNIVNNTKED
ncbi:MAG: hypothetical protein ACOC2E_06925 [Bacteroidota bacterium]